MRSPIPTLLAAALVLGAGFSLAPHPAAAETAPTDSSKAPKALSIFAGIEGVPTLTLAGADVRQQLAVTGTDESGAPADFTRRAKYEVSPPGVVTVDEKGLVTPAGDGHATVVARVDSITASLDVSVEQFGSTPPVNFANRVVPVFTKAGCNSGGCHGKSGGQNGFRLSLLGFEPAEDFEHLVKEARGRRLFPAAPDRSLLLLKATGAMPHGGGKRLEVGSDDYHTVARWISQGMPVGKSDDPTLARIEVYPSQRVMGRGGEQQLVVTARYSDGSAEDVTRGALYEPNDKEMAETDGSGHVQVRRQPGDVAVMVRYQGKVAVFRATVPLGAPVAELPTARNFIDELVFKKLKEIGMPPSPVAPDATFVRRVTIDIAGRLPTPDEAAAFLADTDPAKRDKLIDRLLDSTDYADYFANKWSALLRNKRGQTVGARNTYAFHDWVRDGLAANKPYDQFVREVLTASGDVDDNPAVAWYRQVKEATGQLEDTAQLFMGMRLQCAQCHHHPFERWSQQDYFSFAAFFSRVGRKTGATQGEELIYHRRGEPSATNPRTKQTVKPAGLGGEAVAVSPDDDPRQALADWLTRKQNPFFARALVNRYWKHFLGRGLVEPEDDMRDTNPPTNPDLLAALARHFTDSGYDLKDLVRTICRSTTYQLDALPNEYNKIDRQNYSRYYPKRLQAEVLLDAVNGVTGAESKFDGLPPGTRAVQLPDNSFNQASYFLTVFGRPDASSACECERSMEPSLAQSLHLLNAKDVQDKIAAPSGRAAKLAADKSLTDADRVTELYRWVYTREPRPDELTAATSYVERTLSKATKGHDEAAMRKQAYEDIVWALINTKEFSFNH